LLRLFKARLGQLLAPDRFSSLAGETRVYATRLNRLLLITILAWTVFAIQYYFQARYLTVGIDLAVVCGTLCVHAWFLHQTTLERMRVATHLTAVISSVGLASAAIVSGQSAAMATWFLVFVPIFMVHQEGVKAGVIWSVVTAWLMATVHGSQVLATVTPEFLPSGFELLLGQLLFLVIVLAIGIATRRATDEQLLIVQSREAQLRSSRDASDLLTQRLATLVENVNVGVVLTDANDCVLRVNNRFCDLFGAARPGHELAGIPFEELCSRHIAPAVVQGERYAPADALTKTQEPRQFDLHSGQSVEFERTQIGNAHGGTGFVACYRDITHQKEVERMKDEFVSTVSHELRTPLTAIRGSLALMAGGTAGQLPRESKELVEIADSNAERLVRLISDILDLQRVEAGGISLKRQRVAAHGLARQVADALRPMAAKQGVELLVHENGSLLMCDCDPDRLIQVLTNFVSNAVAFSDKGKSVDMSTRRASSGCVRFEVRDSGPGIALEDQQRMFARFQQLDGSDRRRKSGTGLGLAISRALVEQHGGTIGVESQLGHGATFWFEV
jgi:PAS domain S-box-containing protein